jgi:cytoskeletal protein CcmA (bactofilin family)
VTVARPSFLPAGVRFIGDVEGQGDLVVAGAIDGDVRLEGSLVIEASGAVEGLVEARAIVIAGILVGDASAAESIRIEGQAQVLGDARAPRVHVVEGARLRGRVELTGEHVPRIGRSGRRRSTAGGTPAPSAAGGITVAPARSAPASLPGTTTPPGMAAMPNGAASRRSTAPPEPRLPRLRTVAATAVGTAPTEGALPAGASWSSSAEASVGPVAPARLGAAPGPVSSAARVTPSEVDTPLPMADVRFPQGSPRSSAPAASTSLPVSGSVAGLVRAAAAHGLAVPSSSPPEPATLPRPAAEGAPAGVPVEAGAGGKTLPAPVATPHPAADGTRLGPPAMPAIRRCTGTRRRSTPA